VTNASATAQTASNPPSRQSAHPEIDPVTSLAERYRIVRSETERRASFLSPEDQLVQSMPDASPTKWHRAHTTWFFEQFLLTPHVQGYKPYHPDFAFLFNSYYVTAGPRHLRTHRGMVTRPTVDEVTAYRAHVDAAMEQALASGDDALLTTLAPLIEIGINHEQQHQELLLTDILHAFSLNPTSPSYDASWHWPSSTRSEASLKLSEGIHTVGHQDGSYHFDNERPAHRALVGPVSIDRDLVTNRDWLHFMDDGGYTKPTLWLMDGFATATSEEWDAPGHWRKVDGQWRIMTLGGLKAVDPDAPVCHISYYEADAFARWAGKHLPTEMEWEVAAKTGQLNDAFGILWQWTRSSYSPYPGYKPVDGALGEYNGKFMVNQFVLRGSSLATPDGHSRVSYRNFFYPHHRWQFTGIRLADYAH
jgi:ergothioneine biosynthesis protein EgtB